MPTKVNLHKVKHIVRVLTKCSGNEANRAAMKIYQDPEATALLALACGGAIYGLGAGVKTLNVGWATGTWPVALGGAVVTGVAALATKRFCLEVVNNVSDSISRAEKETLKSKLP